MAWLPAPSRDWIGLASVIGAACNAFVVCQPVIARGVPAPTEHTGVMPPMGGAQLTPVQVRAAAAYVYALSHTGATP